MLPFTRCEIPRQDRKCGPNKIWGCKLTNEQSQADILPFYELIKKLQEDIPEDKETIIYGCG